MAEPERVPRLVHRRAGAVAAALEIVERPVPTARGLADIHGDRGLAVDRRRDHAGADRVRRRLVILGRIALVVAGEIDVGGARRGRLLEGDVRDGGPHVQAEREGGLLGRGPVRGRIEEVVQGAAGRPGRVDRAPVDLFRRRAVVDRDFFVVCFQRVSCEGSVRVDARNERDLFLARHARHTRHRVPLFDCLLGSACPRRQGAGWPCRDPLRRPGPLRGSHPASAITGPKNLLRDASQ
jgi:hypothetical protein